MDNANNEQLMELQFLQQQLEQLSQQQEMIQQQLLDLEISRNALLEIKETKLGTELLTQVANGIFLKSKLADNGKLIVNVGSDVTVEKTIPEVVDMIKEQEEIMKNNAQELEKALEQISSETLGKINTLENKETKAKKE